MAHYARLALSATVAISLASSVACGTNDPIRESAAESVRFIGQSIAGGQPDTDDKFVVAILSTAIATYICSGSLIAPNLVLTAQHCVTTIFPEGGIDCQNSTFNDPHPAASLYVTMSTDAIGGPKTGFRPAAEVYVPPSNGLVCGHDLALIRLKDNITSGETHPINPRIDKEVTDGELYSAIGYGNVNDSSGSGWRRKRTGLKVHCQPGNCDSTYIDQVKEWEGETGICHGDSGGPALDSKGRVVGVVSRGGTGCSSPTYGSPYAWADWIKSVAAQAAKEGGYEPAAWVTGGPSDPDVGSTGPGGPCAKDGDCASKVCATENEQTTYCSQACSDDAGCLVKWFCDTDKGVCLKGGGFGQPCKAPEDCRNGMCAVDSAGAYCTQPCGDGGPECPQPTQCSTDKGWCFVPSAATPETKIESSSGCATSTHARWPIAPWTLALALVALRRRRRSG